MKIREQRRKNIIVPLLVLLCSLSLGYALLRTNLSINGTSKIKGNTWDIHFANLNVTEGSVELSDGDVAASIQSSTTDVSYTITLSQPGDFYEFTVDAVNAGSIDGMIESVTSKLNDTPITTLPSYLDYKVSYSDDTPLAVNHLLKAGESETYKVRLEYKKDITSSDLPETVQSLTFDFSVVYVQADSNAIAPVHPISLYSVLENEAKSNGLARKYTGEHKDSFTEPATHKIYHWYATDYNEGTEVQNKNNLIFAGFCWQMIRTTDTGGVKIIYNGVTNDDKCNNIGAATMIGSSAYNNIINSPAYAGYMYNPSTLISYKEDSAATSGSLFGNGISYANGTYTLTNTSTTYDDNHHYTCNNTTGSCRIVRYYYYRSNYVELADGRDITEALEDMLSSDDVNQTNSTIKTVIDSWFQNNMTSYITKLEDTIFCNDRSISSLGGWNPNGGSTTSNSLDFKNYNLNNDLNCQNITDQFSLANNKAKLTYPVGLMTAPEMKLLNENYARNTEQNYWLETPIFFMGDSLLGYYIGGYGSIYYFDSNQANGVRPAISLAPGTKYIDGDGSKDTPYIIE